MSVLHIRLLTQSPDLLTLTCDKVRYWQLSARETLGPVSCAQTEDVLVRVLASQLREMSGGQQEDVAGVSPGQTQQECRQVSGLPARAEDSGECLCPPDLQTGVLAAHTAYGATVSQQELHVAASNVSLADYQQILLRGNINLSCPALCGTSQIIVVRVLGVNEPVRASDHLSKESGHLSLYLKFFL